LVWNQDVSADYCFCELALQKSN